MGAKIHIYWVTVIENVGVQLIMESHMEVKSYLSHKLLEATLSRNKSYIYMGNTLTDSQILIKQNL